VATRTTQIHAHAAAYLRRVALVLRWVALVLRGRVALMLRGGVALMLRGRVAMWRVALLLRRRVAPIAWRWATAHLDVLLRRRLHLDAAGILVALVELNLVLRLHARAHSAPHDVADDLQDVGRHTNLVAAGDARNDVEDARQVLEHDHRDDDAVVALGGVDS